MASRSSEQIAAAPRDGDEAAEHRGPALLFPDSRPAVDELLGLELAPGVEISGGPGREQGAQRLADLAEAVVAGREGQVGLSLGEHPPQRRADRLVAERGGDRLVEDRELGVDADLDGMGPEQTAGELVEGADRRRLEGAEHRSPSRGVCFRRPAARDTARGSAAAVLAPPCR